jgi:hypothetical protein
VTVPFPERIYPTLAVHPPATADVALERWVALLAGVPTDGTAPTGTDFANEKKPY